MSPRKKRPIPKVEPKAYAEQGYITIKPCADMSVSFEMHHCTAFMSEKEVLSTVLSLTNAAKTLWGQPFMAKLLTQIEIL